MSGEKLIAKIEKGQRLDFAKKERHIVADGDLVMLELTEKHLIGSGITCRTSMEKRVLPLKVVKQHLGLIQTHKIVTSTIQIFADNLKGKF